MKTSLKAPLIGIVFAGILLFLLFRMGVLTREEDSISGKGISNTEELHDDSGALYDNRKANDNILDSFLNKITGVWGAVNNGCYYQFFDGSTIHSGWFESEADPNTHVVKVTEVSKDVYEVIINVDPDPYAYEEDMISDYLDENSRKKASEGYIIIVTYDGSYDGFKTAVIVSREKSVFLLIRMGDNMEEAWNYYENDFVYDYYDLEASLLRHTIAY